MPGKIILVSKMIVKSVPVQVMENLVFMIVGPHSVLRLISKHKDKDNHSAHLYELGAMISPDLEIAPTSALISTLPCPCFTSLPCTPCSLLLRRTWLPPCLPVSTLPQLILSSFLMLPVSSLSTQPLFPD